MITGKLEISGAFLRNTGNEGLKNVVEVSSRLTSLSFYECKLERGKMELLCSGNWSHLKILSLSMHKNNIDDNRIDDEGLMFLPNFTSLQKLYL